MNQSSLFVARDDWDYDCRSGFKSYLDACLYRQKCQMSWINHADYVWLITRNRKGEIVKQVNLTLLSNEQVEKELLGTGIPMK